VRDVMFSFLTYDDQHNSAIRNMFDNIFEEIVTSYVIMENGDIFVKTQGNPSGSFNTIVTNTLTLYMLFSIAWCHLVPDSIDYDEFNDNVVLALCGDDNLGCVHPDYVEQFNVHTIIEVWKPLGVNAKSSAVSEGRLIDLSFLSNAFGLVNGFAVPVPDTEKMISSMLFHTHSQYHLRWSYLKACSMRIVTFLEYSFA